MYYNLAQINTRPRPWEFHTSDMLWADTHIAKQMMSYHLNETVDAASRNHSFIQDSVTWMIDRFSVGEKTYIADFGCGPGLYTLPLAQTGAQITGIDFSVNSLRYARERAAEQGLEINYTLKDYLDYETEQKFDLIIMIMCDFCALSPAQRGIILRKFQRLLKPGGSVVLDVYTPHWFQQKQEAATYEHNHMSGFWSANDYYTFVNIFKYEHEQLILDKYTVIEASRTRMIYNWQQTYNCESLMHEFMENGLNIREWYADVAGSKYDPQSTEMAVVAQSV
ncbi:class I SAM-dependent methyltransferase [Chloroflexota bacterium]